MIKINTTITYKKKEIVISSETAGGEKIFNQGKDSKFSFTLDKLDYGNIENVYSITRARLQENITYRDVDENMSFVYNEDTKTVIPDNPGQSVPNSLSTKKKKRPKRKRVK